jgi:GDPmannose 4,6-dehydratase
MTDSSSLTRIVQQSQPHEIYNLAAQSHVAVSFEEPEYTADSDGLGTLRLLEAIRILGMERKTRFYQASTSELFGKVVETPQKETTPFYPRSPYGAAKLYAYWITVNYRESYGMFACNGILFNHESPIRGETFVSRKITRALARIKLGCRTASTSESRCAARLGPRARLRRSAVADAAAAAPEDFVIATGKQHSVRDFVNLAAAKLGMNLEWRGAGVEEHALDTKGQKIVAVDRRYFRPAEVDTLLGDPSKAKAKLGWSAKTSFDALVEEMTREDLKRSRARRAGEEARPQGPPAARVAWRRRRRSTSRGTAGSRARQSRAGCSPRATTISCCARTLSSS